MMEKVCDKYDFDNELSEKEEILILMKNITIASLHEMVIDQLRSAYGKES